MLFYGYLYQKSKNLHNLHGETEQLLSEASIKTATRLN